MFQTKFIIQVHTDIGEEVRIVGDLEDLGNWNPQKALRCTKNSGSSYESNSSIWVQQNQRFQFKIIRLKTNSTGITIISWQQLPNNANRKYRSKYHSQLFLKWSGPIGKIVRKGQSSNINENMIGPSVDIGFEGYNGKNCLNKNFNNQYLNKNMKLTNKKSFDPSQEANNSDTDSQNQNQSFGSFAHRKKSRDIRISTTVDEFNKLFYGWEVKDLKNTKRKNKGGKGIFGEQKTQKQANRCNKNIQQSQQLYSVNNQNIEFAPDFMVQQQPDINNTHTNIICGQNLRQLVSTDNSIIVIDSRLKSFNEDLFYQLLPLKCYNHGRMAIIICYQTDNNNNISQLIKQFSDRHDICIVSNNFKKLVICGNTYEPIKRHEAIIDFLKKKAVLYQSTHGIGYRYNSNNLQYILHKNNQNCSANNSHKSLMNKVYEQTKLCLNSNGAAQLRTNYFKIDMKAKKQQLETDVKMEISWTLDKQIRMLRTLFKLKEMEDGYQEYDVYFISTNTPTENNTQQNCSQQLSLEAIAYKLKQYNLNSICSLRYNVIPQNQYD